MNWLGDVHYEYYDEDDTLAPCLSRVVAHAVDRVWLFHGPHVMDTYSFMVRFSAAKLIAPDFDASCFMKLLRARLLPGLRLSSGSGPGACWDRLICNLLFDELFSHSAKPRPGSF